MITNVFKILASIIRNCASCHLICFYSSTLPTDFLLMLPLLCVTPPQKRSGIHQTANLVVVGTQAPVLPPPEPATATAASGAAAVIRVACQRRTKSPPEMQTQLRAHNTNSTTNNKTLYSPRSCKTDAHPGLNAPL